jgi:regulator of sigma E protease
MLVKIGQLFLSLTILITLHEFGHFWFARRFKTRVDKFYLFFDFLFPFAGLLNFSLFKKKIGDTEYGLGWFPFGGYVQIAGMVDEQMDKDMIDRPAEPWELRSKPAWQRLLVMLGGIIVNLLLGFFIFWMVLWAWGKNTQPITGLKHGIHVDSVAYKMGFRNGDYIVSLDKKLVTSLGRIPIEIIMNKVSTVEGVHANGEAFVIPVTDEDRSIILKNLKHSMFIVPRTTNKVDSIEQNSYASNSDLKKGDEIIGVNGVSVKFYDELKGELDKFKGKEVKLTLLRGKDTVYSTNKITTEGTVGFHRDFESSYTVRHESFGFFEAFIEGSKDAWEKVIMQAKQLVVIFTVKDAYLQIGGFATMTKAMPSVWDWEHFWLFTGFLSLALAFMNFLPIPMLDGGYVMFILWEMITGKKVSDKVIYYANNVGLYIVLGLMIFANTDWLRDMFQK